jgi:hypothetical protein
MQHSPDVSEHLGLGSVGLWLLVVTFPLNYNLHAVSFRPPLLVASHCSPEYSGCMLWPALACNASSCFHRTRVKDSYYRSSAKF